VFRVTKALAPMIVDKCFFSFHRTSVDLGIRVADWHLLAQFDRF